MYLKNNLYFFVIAILVFLNIGLISVNAANSGKILYKLGASRFDYGEFAPDAGGW